MLRGSENMLDLTIFGPRNSRTLTSMTEAEFAIVLRFTVGFELPDSVPEVFLPLTVSRHIRIGRAAVTLSHKTIEIELLTDRLGLI